VWSVTWGTLDGKPVVASSGADGTVRLWDPSDGAERLVLQGHAGWVWSLAWGSLDGLPVLASADDDGTVRLCNPKQAQEAVIDLGSGEVFTVSLGPNGWLGIAGWEGLAALVIRPEAYSNPRTAQRWSPARVRP
jgi:WD40 repeat protein